MRVLSGVTQKNRDRNATRSLDWQQVNKATLQGKPGYDEYNAECDAANPPKTAQIFKIRCTKDDMVEKLPLVHHGLVDMYSFTQVLLICIAVTMLLQVWPPKN